MESIKTFKFKPSLSRNNIIGGGILLVIGIILGVLTMRFMPAILGILFVFIGIKQQSMEVIRFLDKHLEIRLAPISGIKLIRYTDISNVDVVNNKRIEIQALILDKNKTTKIPLNSFTEEDQKAILSELSLYTQAIEKTI